MKLRKAYLRLQRRREAYDRLTADEKQGRKRPGSYKK